MSPGQYLSSESGSSNWAFALCDVIKLHQGLSLSQDGEPLT